MVKIVNNVLTSPCNAHSLTIGDKIMGLDGPMEITGTRSPRWIVQPDNVKRLVVDLWINGQRLILGANLPMDRIVGARSAGQVN